MGATTPRRGHAEFRAGRLEPWLVSHRGRRVRLAPAPLLGGHLRLAAGLAVTDRVRLGIFAELALSSAPRGRAVQALASDARLFTLGSLESSLGLEVRVALAPGPFKLPKPR